MNVRIERSDPSRAGERGSALQSFLDLLSCSLGGILLMVVFFSMSLKKGDSTEDANFAVISFESKLNVVADPSQSPLVLNELVDFEIEYSPDVEFPPIPSTLPESTDASGATVKGIGRVRWIHELNPPDPRNKGEKVTLLSYCIVTELQGPFSFRVDPPRSSGGSGAAIYEAQGQVFTRSGGEKLVWGKSRRVELAR